MLEFAYTANINYTTFVYNMKIGKIVPVLN
jgi:hypothetical protein